MSEALREKMWLWGHPEGIFNHKCGNGGESRMTPAEACLYLGVRNVFMVPMDIEVNRRQYNKSFTTFRNVGWETFAATRELSVLDGVASMREEFPNVTAVVYDDFKRTGLTDFDYHREIPLENLKKAHERLHRDPENQLDMWMVLYTHEFGTDEAEDNTFMKYIEPFDGVIMWTWKESDVPLIPEKFEIFKRMTPKQRRMFGCYLWNFGEDREATRKAVLWQLDFYLERIRRGEAEGIVLHTNTMADLDYDAYDAAREWMESHGDELI